VSRPVLLVAHGSRDPRAAATTRSLARVVARLRPTGPVEVAFLDHAGPRVGEALRSFDADTPVAVVPLLLTAAYHGRVDLPAALAEARAAGVGTGAILTDVLGPTGPLVPAALLAGLRRRVLSCDTGCDAVVLAAAGTRDVNALSTVDQVAAALGSVLGVPCRAAYASAATPTAGEAVRSLRAAGARRVAMAAYFLATGRLYRSAADSALAAGAVAVAEPLGDAPELARLVVDRVAQARTRGLARV
jgi:sirohydrochlorin ferrochelatase